MVAASMSCLGFESSGEVFESVGEVIEECGEKHRRAAVSIEQDVDVEVTAFSMRSYLGTCALDSPQDAADLGWECLLNEVVLEL